MLAPGSESSCLLGPYHTGWHFIIHRQSPLILLLSVRLSPRLPEGGDTTATIVPGIVLNTQACNSL